jgi:hypothetical protein
LTDSLLACNVSSTDSKYFCLTYNLQVDTIQFSSFMLGDACQLLAVRISIPYCSFIPKSENSIFLVVNLSLHIFNIFSDEFYHIAIIFRSNFFLIIYDFSGNVFFFFRKVILLNYNIFSYRSVKVTILYDVRSFDKRQIYFR